MSTLALGLCGAVLVFLVFSMPSSAQVPDPCAAPANEIVAENCKSGNPSDEWDISGSGSDTIQGFATDMSVDQGQRVDFKVDTVASDYRLDIYRMGYYEGDGARKVATKD
jgi:hypothetical protein